jgi:hypothetical protein
MRAERVAPLELTRQPSAPQTAAGDAGTSPPRRARSSRRARGERQRILVPEPQLVVQIDPEWTDRELLRAYQGQLETLRLGRRAKAATIARFRETNREAEARLRATLPDLIGPIDAFYAWAAKYAR